MWIILLEMKTPRCLYLCNNQVITPCIVLQMVISDYMRDNSTIRCFLANFVKLRNMCWLLISMTSLQHLANLHAKSITNNKQISWHNPVMRHNQGRQEKSGVVELLIQSSDDDSKWPTLLKSPLLAESKTVYWESYRQSLSQWHSHWTLNEMINKKKTCNGFTEHLVETFVIALRTFE